MTPFADHARVHLYILRQRRTTWYDTSDMELRRRIDAELDDFWITEEQHRLASLYGAAVAGGDRGSVLFSWPDGRRGAFFLTDSISTVDGLLRGLCPRDDVRDIAGYLTGAPEC
jgi:hypothetical protein